MAVSPLNIIVSPFEVYIAPVGTAFPLIAVAPPIAWKLLGEGMKSYNEDGVTIQHMQTIDLHRFLGSNAPRKATRSSEEVRVNITCHDLTLETYGQVLGVSPVTTAPATGAPGTKHIPLYRGFDVNQFAFLVRGPSPYLAGHNAQYEIPVAVIDGEPEVTYNKTEPAGLELSLVVLEDPNAVSEATKYGRFVAASLAALP